MIDFKKRKIIPFITTFLIIFTVFMFWVTGIIPSFIAKVCAERYVKSKYMDKGLQYSKVFWDDNWSRYFVSFIDKSGKIYNFKMSEYIPDSVMYDPINPPG